MQGSAPTTALPETTIDENTDEGLNMAALPKYQNNEMARPKIWVHTHNTREAPLRHKKYRTYCIRLLGENLDG